MTRATKLDAVTGSPAHWCAAFALALVVLVETGRHPIDNPDTHLELTMVHEGPLLEYAGRDLAMLQWTSAARHWIVLVLAVGLFVPLPADELAAIAGTAICVGVLCIALGLVDSSLAKLRILRVPALLGTGLLVCAIGVASQVVGT
jgi:formate hydrogenlyase subunit 4